MPPVYATTSLGTALTQLSTRLGDPGQVFWPPAELTDLIWDALRTWQVYAGAYRIRDTVDLTAGTGFYDLATLFPSSWTVTLTDQALINVICDALVEPRPVWTTIPTPWAGSAQFTLDGITQAIQRRRDQFLVETGLVLTHRQQPVASPPIGREVLPQRVAAVRRVHWIDTTATQAPSPCYRIDPGAANSFQVGWSLTPSTPRTWSVLETPPLQLQLVPPPIDAGTIDLLTIETGPILTPASGATILGIPDDWVWVIRWGALADLLTQTGIARDAARAQYCEGRWSDGIALARHAVSVLDAQINGVPVSTIDSVADWDRFWPAWLVPGAPSGVALAGPNLLAVGPIPDSNGPYSLTVDLLGAIPIPVLPGDYLPVGGETLDVVLDYAAHLGAFKQGGQEFQVSIAQYQRFVAAARREQSRIRATSLYADVLAKQGQRQTSRLPDRDAPPALPVGMEAA